MKILFLLSLEDNLDILIEVGCHTGIQYLPGKEVFKLSTY